MIRKLIKNILRLIWHAGAKCVIPPLIKYLPLYVKRFIAKKGLCFIVGPGVTYQGNIFGTPYKIQASTDFPVEVEATSKFSSSSAELAIRQAARIIGRSFRFIDIGANVGTYTLLMRYLAGSLGNGTVFEPGPLYEKLLNNMRQNGVTDVIAFRCGLGEKRGTLYWTEDTANSGNAHLIDPHRIYDWSNVPTKLSRRKVPVEVKLLDDFENLLGSVDLIKIDVEGMEIEVLKGGISVIKKSRPLIVLELFGWSDSIFGEPRRKLISTFFSEQNYVGFDCTPNGECKPYAGDSKSQDVLFVPKEKVLNWSLQSHLLI